MVISPRWDASSLQVSPSISSGFPDRQFAVTHSYSWVETGTVGVYIHKRKTAGDREGQSGR